MKAGLEQPDRVGELVQEGGVSLEFGLARRMRPRRPQHALPHDQAALDGGRGDQTEIGLAAPHEAEIDFREQLGIEQIYCGGDRSGSRAA